MRPMNAPRIASLLTKKQVAVVVGVTKWTRSTVAGSVTQGCKPQRSASHEGISHNESAATSGTTALAQKYLFEVEKVDV